MKKILGLVVLSLFAISASAADLMASSAAPTVTQNIVVEGAACPGVGATGFSSTGLLLSCQSGRWAQQFSGLNYSYITVTLVNPGSGTSSLGYHT
ncbi:shufflon system plasmid conjugative transfer pilus tip adhesin PilV, partial [Pseudomonas aeruginosa]|nr:shufflon system plasmid conjugative transfer pilus tip adhesin PilV [Pseudomonas aeruginosa]